MLAATPAELAERRLALARTPVLARLAERLRVQVQPLLDRPINLPNHKALLSRDGGVCPDDGSRLAFDPFSPDRHQCPRCRKWFESERHHRAWIVRYQIWLSERIVHLALLGALYEDPSLTTRATEILSAYTDRYREYPNRDNVLGPTRLFFSTYLESIWLCQVTAAASLLDGAGAEWPAGLRDRLGSVVGESAELIASFDEGWSNRQAWNNSAMIGAGRWLGAQDLVSRGLDGPHGMRASLATAVSADGLWFEGENYHFFALRGLLLGAEFLRCDGPDLYADRKTGKPLAALYAAPLKTVLPDLTLPARGDSPYGVSLFQPRFAELWEIGRVRTGDPVLEHLLAGLYGGSSPGMPPEGPDYGMTELSEQEQNRPAQRLSRERLGWKALLWMAEDDPAGGPASVLPGSVLLADHGVGVLRQGNRYLSMECGGARGGHGHPDLLHVTLHWGAPWLADPGTASYVTPSLHWYRSTLAHNAPGLAGSGQLSREGWCSAFGADGEITWMRAAATDLFGPGTSAVRTLVASPAWVLDVLDVGAPAGVELDLAIHPLGTVALPAEVGRLAASPSYLGTAGVLDTPLLAARARYEGEEMFMGFAPRAGEEWYVPAGLGPPDALFADGPPLEFLVRRASGTGRWIQVYSREPVSLQVQGANIGIVQGESVSAVRFSGTGARVRTADGRTVKLTGSRSRPRPRPAPVARPQRRPVIAIRLAEGGAGSHAPIHLGADHYRRSEEPYDPADFQADVAIFAAGQQLCFGIQVLKPALVIRRPDDADPALDNERPDINSDGVQFFIDCDGWQGFVLVPDADSERVYIRPVDGTRAELARVSATWARRADGYRMMMLFDVGRPVRRGDRWRLNLVINRMDAGRERRAGQLVLSGDTGWLYLRGDRESPDSAVVVEVQ